VASIWRRIVPVAIPPLKFRADVAAALLRYFKAGGSLRAILGEDPAYAFMAATDEDLQASENEDEKKAASGFKTMLAAFPDKDWRRRCPP